jgi:hypothetical protein
LVKDKLQCEGIRHSAFTGKSIKKVAVLGGSGSFAIKNAISSGADAYLTADLKYHQFYEAEKQSFKASGLGGSRMGPAGFQRFCRRKALIANRGDVTPLSAYSEET